MRTHSISAAVAPTRASGRARTIATGVLGSLSFAALTWLGAHMVIPIQPVPITMQTLFVLLAGAMVGRSAGAGSQILYAGLGAAGLPVFATGAAGFGVFGGPTGGFLLSFLVVPFVVGSLIRRSDSMVWHACVFSLATLVIFLLGVSHLALFYTHSVSAALGVGVLPFVPGAVFKVVAATSIYRSWRGLRARAG